MSRNDCHEFCCIGVDILWFGRYFKYYLQWLTYMSAFARVNAIFNCNMSMPCGSSHTIAVIVVYILSYKCYRCIPFEILFHNSTKFLIVTGEACSRLALSTPTSFIK